MARVTGVRALPILGLVFVTLGLVGLIAAGVLAWREQDSSRTATADGVIVDFNNGPVVEFTTAQGTTAQFRSPVRSTTFARGSTCRWPMIRPIPATLRSTASPGAGSCPACSASSSAFSW